MIRRPPRSTQSRSSAASDVYKRQTHTVLVKSTLLVVLLGCEIRDTEVHKGPPEGRTLLDCCAQSAQRVEVGAAGGPVRFVPHLLNEPGSELLCSELPEDEVAVFEETRSEVQRNLRMLHAAGCEELNVVVDTSIDLVLHPHRGVLEDPEVFEEIVAELDGVKELVRRSHPKVLDGCLVRKLSAPVVVVEDAVGGHVGEPVTAYCA